MGNDRDIGDGGVVKRYKLPERCAISSFTMRELTGVDQIEAAIWADKTASSGIRDNPLAMLALEQEEAMRLSLLLVDDAPVNVDGVPYTGMKRWTARTKRFLLRAFHELNGATELELEAFTKGAEVEMPSRPGKLKAVDAGGRHMPEHDDD